jgi:hypothetical protein
LLFLLLQEDQTDEEIDLTESANTGGNREENKLLSSQLFQDILNQSFYIA